MWADRPYFVLFFSAGTVLRTPYYSDISTWLNSPYALPLPSSPHFRTYFFWWGWRTAKAPAYVAAGDQIPLPRSAWELWGMNLRGRSPTLLGVQSLLRLKRMGLCPRDYIPQSCHPEEARGGQSRRGSNASLSLFGPGGSVLPSALGVVSFAIDPPS